MAWLADRTVAQQALAAEAGESFKEKLGGEEVGLELRDALVQGVLGLLPELVAVGPGAPGERLAELRNVSSSSNVHVVLAQGGTRMNTTSRWWRTGRRRRPRRKLL